MKATGPGKGWVGAGRFGWRQLNGAEGPWQFSPAVDKYLEGISKLLLSVLDSCLQALLHVRIIWGAFKSLYDAAEVTPQTN